MSREDFTTLWVKKSTAARLAATGEGTADEQINGLIDGTAVDRTKKLEEWLVCLWERTGTAERLKGSYSL